jgi:putative transposase
MASPTQGGCQFTGHEWQTFLRDHNLVGSMSRRGNCHDNAVAESFFQLLKRERIRRQVYATRNDARADVFNYIEMFYNPKRRHGTAVDTSPVEFERRHSQRCLGNPGRFTPCGARCIESLLH